MIDVIGISLHHMKITSAINDLSEYELYEKKLLQLEPLLRHVANKNHIIWMNQYSVNDFRLTARPDMVISSMKIHHLNVIAKRVLR